MKLSKGNVEIFTENIEPEALNQIYNLIEQPAFVNSKIRIMPDVHAGAGCVIGFTADLGDKVIPNIVGVDIGCGMHVVKLGKINIDLEALDNFIKEKIPSGFCVNGKVQYPFDFSKSYCYNELLNINRLELSIGSLGGGNHFIEIDKDENGDLWLVIHTGSRNYGLQVAKIYQDKAVTHCRKLAEPEINEKIEMLKKQGRQSEISEEIKKIRKKYEQYKVPKELAFLDGELRDQYIHDMKLCQEFAVINRKIIAKNILNFLKVFKPIEEWETIHNYVDDNNMIRKGAISADVNEKVIIPLNMRDGSIIGIGKGNENWNKSGPHGAGRILARGQAKQLLNVDDFKSAMEGIYTTTADESTIDESPMAYKPADEIINAIGDSIDIVSIIKPIYNFKAAE